MNHRSLVAALVLGVAVVGCGKSDAPAGSTPAAGAKATLKLADVKAAYKSEIDNTAKMKDPMDKKVAAFVAKVGKPESDDGRVLTWHALDNGKCSKVQVDRKDGSITDSTVSNSECGL